jgi:hypothetical protein
MSKHYYAEKIGEWEAITGAGAAADAFNEEIGSVIGEEAVDPADVQREKFKTAKRLSDFGGFRFYTLGPAYVHVGIPVNLLGVFGQLTGFEGPQLLHKFDHDLFSGLAEWGNCIEGMPEEHYIALQHYMATQVFTREDAGEYWSFDYKEVSIPDPFAVDRKEAGNGTAYATVGVFLPSGNKYRLDTGGLDGVTVRLVPRPAKAEVLHEASVVLKNKGATDGGGRTETGPQDQ